MGHRTEVPRWVGPGSAAGDEGDDDVRGVAVEVLASPVVDRRSAGIGMTGRDLHVPERDAGIEGRHDERGSQHVRVDSAEPGALSDRAGPAMRGSPVKALTVTAPQDRSLVALTDRQVDRPGGPGDERYGGRFVALAHDPQGAVAALKGEVLDVGGTGLADTEPVQAEQHGERGVVTVVLLGGEEEHAKLRAIQTASGRGMDLRSADVPGGVRADASVDVRKPVEPTDRRQATVDRRRGEPAVLHPGTEQLDVRATRPEHGDALVGGPLEEAAQVVAIRLERPAAVAGKERNRSELRFIELEPGLGLSDRRRCRLDGGHGWSSLCWEDQPTCGGQPAFWGQSGQAFRSLVSP